LVSIPLDAQNRKTLLASFTSLELAFKSGIYWGKSRNFAQVKWEFETIEISEIEAGKLLGWISRKDANI
jgi:hypothetical protein